MINGSQGPYRNVTTNLDRTTAIENLGKEVGKQLQKKEINLLEIISAGDDAEYKVGNNTFTGQAAVVAAQGAYQRLQRVWSTIQSILQSSHQMLMESIRNIGRT